MAGSAFCPSVFSFIWLYVSLKKEESCKIRDLASGWEFAHLFIFRNHFIVVRMLLDLKTILRILSTCWENTLDEMQVHHVHTVIHTLGVFQCC